MDIHYDSLSNIVLCHKIEIVSISLNEVDDTRAPLSFYYYRCTTQNDSDSPSIITRTTLYKRIYTVGPVLSMQRQKLHQTHIAVKDLKDISATTANQQMSESGQLYLTIITMDQTYHQTNSTLSPEQFHPINRRHRISIPTD